MPYTPSLSTATVKIARKDVISESYNSPSILQGEEHSHSVQCLNEIVVGFLGDYNTLSEPEQRTDGSDIEITTIPRSHEPELSEFRLFSWSTATQPIELTRLYQLNPTTPYVSYEDTDDEAKHREERAKQISIEGVEILRGLQYPSPFFKRNYTPESMKPVLPCNFKPPNLMVAKKEGSVTSAISETESVLFPRTKCCAVIPVKSLEDKSKKHRRKRKHIHRVQDFLFKAKKAIRGKR